MAVRNWVPDAPDFLASEHVALLSHAGNLRWGRNVERIACLNAPG
jgi:hypothetical protein